jgi:anti-sigma factor RsiW
MQCGAARKHLYLLHDSDSEKVAFPKEAESAQAEAHVSHCEACQEFFASEERLRELLRARGPRERVSAALRERVLSEVARERKQTARRSRWLRELVRSRMALALAGLLVLAVLAGSFWLINKPSGAASQQLASVLIDDHAHGGTRPTDVASSDHTVVQSWFEGKVDFNFRLPAAIDRSLIGGRLCNLQGRRAALIYYQQPQSRVSLFIFDGADVHLPDDQLISLDGKRCLMDSNKGYNAVLWKERGLVYGLVSDASRVDLLHLAAQF